MEDYDIIIVAIHENKVVGTIAYKHKDEESAELKRVYIQKEHRGKGLAKPMLEEIIKKIKEKDYKKILVETWKSFGSGRRFYEKNNFMLQSIEGEVYNFVMEL